MPDSLILDETIELLGGRAVSQVPECQGATFMLGPGWSEGAPQPEIDITETLALDGEIPIGDRMSNRTISLPVVIQAPTRSALASAREYLLRTVTKKSFTMRWTREGSTLPLLFDCFKAAASTVTQSLPVERGALASQVTVTFPAKPYGRSDTPQVVDFQSPLANRPVPPVPVTVDNFSSVSGTQWAASPLSPLGVGQSAFWDPTINPANNPAGIGQKAVYSKSGLSLDLAAGWTAISQNNSGLQNLIVLLQNQIGPIKVGDTFQIATSFLTGDASNFDGGTIANWAPTPSTGNCSLTNTTAQAHSGTHSMQMSSTAAGTMTGQSTITPLTQAMAVIAGDVCWASAWFRTQTSGRNCLIGVAFYDAVGNFLSTGFGFQSGITDLTTAWTQTSTALGVIAPTGSAWAVAFAQVTSTGGIAEIHYVDDVILAGRGTSPAQAQIFTVQTIGPPASGFNNVTFTPNMTSSPQTGQVIIQVGPPQLSALTLQAGFGSTLFFHHFSRLGGRVTFAFTLTDTYGTVISFSKTVQIYGANDYTAPKWEKIKIPIPFSALFDYHNVTAYSLTVTNRTIGLHYSQLYISNLMAVPPPLPLVSPSRGVLYEMSGVVGSARAPCAMQFQQTGSNTYIKILNVPGAGQWKCPPGVTSVAVFAIGGGGAASFFNTVGLGGGGGAGSAANAAVAVTAGNYYNFVVGIGGAPPPGGPPPLFVGVGRNPTNSTFTGDAATVTAFAGGMAPGGTTGGAAGAAGTGGFAGGAGGAGVNASNGAGGGGGGSGGTATAGNPGSAGSGTTGGLGAVAVAGGGPGGNGGTTGHGNGRTPVSGYGGGGGGSPANGHGGQYAGYGGVVQLTYTSTTPLFQTLLVHRPRKDAPTNLVPFVSPSPDDVPNNGIGYIVGTLTPGVQPKFDGTYTVVAVAYSWATPASPSTITVTVAQSEASGTVYTTNCQVTVTPNQLPSTPGTTATHGPFVVVGEVTLPINEVAPDNKNSWYSVSINDTNTGDRFQDILFLDTQGSSIAIESSTGYFNYFLDSPTDTRDIGYVLASLYDRDDAISVLDRMVFLSGGPMSVDPFGSPFILVYAAEGAPNMQLVYYPTWLQDRQQ